jgi:hypothetical protein
LVYTGGRQFLARNHVQRTSKVHRTFRLQNADGHPVYTSQPTSLAGRLMPTSGGQEFKLNKDNMEI